MYTKTIYGSGQPYIYTVYVCIIYNMVMANPTGLPEAA